MASSIPLIYLLNALQEHQHAKQASIGKLLQALGLGGPANPTAHSPESPESARWSKQWNEGMDQWRAESSLGNTLGRFNKPGTPATTLAYPFRPEANSLHGFDLLSKLKAQGKGDPYMTQPWSLPRMATEAPDWYKMRDSGNLPPYRPGHIPR